MPPSAERESRPFQFSLRTLLNLTTVLSVLLAIPLVGRLIVLFMLIPLSILGVLMLLQLPLYLPILLLERARRRRETREHEWSSG